MYVFNCQLCGKEKQTHSKYQANKYCSRECSNKAKIGVKHPIRIYGPITKNCESCNKEFLVGGNTGITKRTKHCSDECRYKVQVDSRKKECNNLEPTIASYIAGFTDGEGCITFSRMYKKDTSITLILKITNTKIEVLDKIKDWTGVGSVVESKTRSEKWCNTLQWQCISWTAESVIKQLLPYLIVKKPQAELAIDAMNKLKDLNLKKDSSWQEEYNKKMKDLNARGKRRKELEQQAAQNESESSESCL